MKGAQSKSVTAKADAQLKVKSGGARKRGTKAAKDPNKPKRPPSGFFVFMEEFRKQYKLEHPENKLVSAVGKACGAKWKTMSDAEKAPYLAKAEKRKSDYTKELAAYNKKQSGADDNESDKSKSEVNDDENEEGSGEEEDDEA